MNRFLCGAIAAALMAIPAGAADLSRPMPVKAPPVVAPPTWAGWYVGAHGGYGWEDPSASFNPATFATLIPDPGLTVTGSSGPINLSVSPKGPLGGLQFGYNWQNGSLVYGFEADVSFSNIKASASAPFSVLASDPDTLNFSGVFFLDRKIDYFGTLRGRLGWAFGNLLLFTDGGFAWGHVKTTMGVRDAATGFASNFPAGYPAALNRQVSSSDLQYGFALGAGGEWMFAPQWSVRAEYLFIDLVGGGSDLTFTGASFTDSKVQMHVARAALNYKFAP